MTRPLLAALLFLATPALADGDPWIQEGTGKLEEKVDFSKPPGKVESYNKVRFTVTPRQGDKGLELQVEGQAYYPDDARLTVAVRYWKHDKQFAHAKTRVKDQAFSCVVGPFPKEVPGGKLHVEAWFLLRKQPQAVRKAMEEGKYFSCTPPCRFDTIGVVRVLHDMGGDEAQARAEAAEKRAMEQALRAAIDARRVAGAVFEEVRKKSKGKADAKAALDRLEADLTAAQEDFEAWKTRRQLLLFPAQASDLRSLFGGVRIEGRTAAAVAGVDVDTAGGPRVTSATGRTTPFMRYTKAREDVDARAAALKGFLAEERSLDRIWEAKAKEAEARAAGRKAASGK